MKRAFLYTILTLLLFSISTATAASNNATVTTFSQAYNSSKPMALYVYAPWSGDATAIARTVTALRKNYGNKANIVAMDIASQDAKIFSDMFPIQPKLPHVLLMKDKGKIIRKIPADCALDYACISKKVVQFAN